MSYVIRYGNDWYSKRYATFGGNATTLDRATRWSTRAGAERRAEMLREYKRTLGGSSAMPDRIEVVEVAQ